MLFFSKSPKIETDLRLKLNEKINSLSPWYQPIEFARGVKTIPVTKSGHKISLRDLDRGIKKWNKFIKPALPFDLKDKTVLDCGCNAGLFLVQSIREGAKKAIGIEVDDHYFNQSKFVREAFSEIEGRDFQIETHKSSFEDFDYESIGKVDITFFLNTLYHIGRATHANSDPETILNVQSEMIKRISKISKYILFQSNALKDEGRGKGQKSLHEILSAADVEIVEELDFNHERGLITVVTAK